MPFYDVKCESCGHESECKHGWKEDHPACPECGGVNKTLIKACNFTLVGSGWASKEIKDDYLGEMEMRR